MKDMDAADVDVPTAVLEALCDDLNTPQAIAEMNALLKQNNSPELKGQLIAAGELLNILQEDAAAWLGFGDEEQGDDIQALLEERTAAKAEKNFARADEIRDELAAQGIEIVDTSEGPKWRKAN